MPITLDAEADFHIPPHRLRIRTRVTAVGVPHVRIVRLEGSERFELWSELQLLSELSLVCLTPDLVLWAQTAGSGLYHLAIIDPCSQLPPKLDQSIPSLVFAPNPLLESAIARVRPVTVFLIRNMSSAPGRFLPLPSLKYASNQTSSSLLKGSWINSMPCFALSSPSFPSRMLSISCSNRIR